MNSTKSLYVFFLFLLTVQISFCLTEKDFLVKHLRDKAKRYQNASWLKESRDTFYDENKKEIHRLHKIIRLEQKQQQRLEQRYYEQNRSSLSLFQTARELEQCQNSTPPRMERQNAFCFRNNDWEEE